MTYKETLDYLFRQLPMYQKVGKKAFKKDLTNIRKLCTILGQPEQQFKSIHIAGTNGKGSTAHMMSSVLQEAGYKTGLYTSPHLKDFRERIRINGNQISQEKVVQFVEQYQHSFEDIQASFFEWTVALTFHTFAQEKVDIAVIETGLGGRLDSTNIISPELSIITNIGYDHMDTLGDTLQKIATEKAGIIKKETPVVVVNHSGEKAVFLKKAEEENAPIQFADDLSIEEKLESDLQGSYQQENTRGVYVSFLELKKMGWKLTTEHLKKGLLNVVANTQLRGRWDILQKKPLIIADTAHNKEGLSMTLKQVLSLEYEQLHFVIGFVKDKNVENVLPLFPKDAHYYFCAATISRALDHESLLRFAQQYGLNGASFSSVTKALEAAKSIAKTSDVIYVGGSNFVVAEIL